MKLKIKFILSKGDGALPDLGLLPLDSFLHEFYACL